MPVLSRAKLSAECGGLMKQALCSDVTHCSNVTVCTNVIHQVMPNGRAAMSWDGRKMSQRIPSSSGSHKQDKLLWVRLGHALVAIFTCFAMMIGCQRQESSLQPASSSEQTMAGPGERQRPR